MSHHHAKMGSRRWERARKACFTRDHWRCQVCGHAGWPLEAHHAQPLNAGGEQYELTNLVTLCRACHLDVHRVVYDAQVAAWDRLVAEMLDEGPPPNGAGR